MNRSLLGLAAVVTAAVLSAVPTHAQPPRVEAQSSASTPTFEIASVRIADPRENGPGDIPRNMNSTPGRFLMRKASLRYCLEWAYGRKDYEIAGPDWINSEKSIGYDIRAAAPGATESEMRLMLQALLLERFRMKVHREAKNVDGYVLLPGKGAPKLKPATDDEDASLDGDPQGKVKYTKQPVSRFMYTLTHRMGRPAIDMTGLNGLYDFTIDISGLTLVDGLPTGDFSATSIFTAVQRDLGLRLEGRKITLDMLVIDHVEKVPTEN